MDEFLSAMMYWHWFGLGMLLLIIEVLSGTGFLLWVGIAALFVGALLFLVPSLSIGIQLVIFALVSILSALLWWWYLQYRPIQSDVPRLNRRAEQYIGRIFTLQVPVVNGVGRIHVDDTMWLVRCESDLPSGVNVHVTGTDGIYLLVEQYEV